MNKISGISRTLIIVTIITGLLAAYTCARASADTINTNDGREIKGIVVEDYKDRFIFSTIDGEVSILKSDIRELYFDSEEDNLVNLADQARERRNFQKAYAYYELALKKNPGSKAATDGLVFCQGYLFRKGEAKKLDDIARREEFEQYGNAVVGQKSAEDELNASIERLKSSVGISLSMQNNVPIVERIKNGSPAAEAGIEKGDRIAAIWGRLTGYMSLPEVVSVLMEKPSLEIKCTIERVILIAKNKPGTPLAGLKDLIGATLSMEFDGLTVKYVQEGGPSDIAGLKAGDLIVSINNNPTRYMPIAKAIELIKNSRLNASVLNIRRNLLIWRNDVR